MPRMQRFFFPWLSVRGRPFGVALAILSLWSGATYGAPLPLVDDRYVTIHSTREAKEKREQLIRYVWGAKGFPKDRKPDQVITNVASPVHHLDQLARVDEFRMQLAPGLEGVGLSFYSQTHSGLRSMRPRPVT
jgi:hypothetical protein